MPGWQQNRDSRLGFATVLPVKLQGREVDGKCKRLAFIMSCSLPTGLLITERASEGCWLLRKRENDR